MIKLNSKTKTNIKKIAIRYNLAFVVLYGSEARSQAHKKSDLDIAILSKQKFDYLKEAKIREEFCQIFNRPDVEVIDVRGGTPLFLFQIIRDGVLLFEDKFGRFARFQIYAFRRYVEAKPLLELRQIQLEKHLKKI